MKNTDGLAAPGPDASRSRQERVPGDEVAYVARGGEVLLSNFGQLEMLLAMGERGVALRTAVRGSSMSPSIQDRDVLTIAPLGKNPARPGEVVAFRHPVTGCLVVHRIVGRTASGFLFKGDNHAESDGEVSTDSLLGRVIRVERDGREVPLGVGSEHRKIYTFILYPFLARLRWLRVLPRRVVGFFLRRLQGLSLYRQIGRKLLGPIVITVADEAEMERVFRTFGFTAPYYRRATNSGTVNLVAKIKDKTIGFVQLVIRPAEQAVWSGHWLHSLVVKNYYRGLGVGEKLTERVVAIAAAGGAQELLLAVNQRNRNAIALYSKQGFVIAKVPELEALWNAEAEKTKQRRLVMRKNWDSAND